jgi:hypothetical protein
MIMGLTKVDMVFFDMGPLIFGAITAPVHIYKWELVYMSSFFF